MTRRRLVLGLMVSASILCVFVIASAQTVGRGPEAAPADFTAACPPRLDPALPLVRDAWRSRYWLQRHAERAAEAIEWACGSQFGALPRVRSATLQELASDAVLNAQLKRAAMLDVEVRSIRHYEGSYAEIVAAYLPLVDTVYVCPDELAAFLKDNPKPGMRSRGLLQLALVHELVHALDYRRHAHWLARGEEREGKSWQALDAVREGHAQHVVRRIAKAWGMDREWAIMLTLWGAEPGGSTPYYPDGDPGLRYVTGQRFCDHVFEELGREGLERALREPPERLYYIRRPDVWVSRYRSGALDAVAPITPAPEGEFLLAPGG